jgi:hypothetical protein
MKRSNETVGQAWMRELSLVAVDKTNVATFELAQKAVLALNPTLGMDGKALYFAAQGWMAAQQQAVVAT